LHPQYGRRSLTNTEKNFKKDLHGIDKGFTFALRKTMKFFERMSKEKEKKYFFSIYLRVKKKDVLLHPLNERMATQKRMTRS